MNNKQKLINTTPKLCIKCETDKKDKEYPMCYSCFLKWDADPNFLRGNFKTNGVCLIMSDSDDDE